MTLQDIPLGYSKARNGFLLPNNLIVGGNLTIDGSLTVGGVPLSQPNIQLPADHGAIGWTMDPAVATSTSALTNGTVYLARIPVRAATTISTVWWCQTTAPATPTTGQCYAGLYNTAGTLLSSAAIEGKTTNGVQSVALAASQAVSAGYVWVGFVWNAGTAPTVMRGGGQNMNANNFNLTAATQRFAVNGTGQTALPSPITPASNSSTGAVALWAAIS